MSTQLVQAAWGGILFGSVYGLMALGLTLVWGAVRLLNLAHGALFVVGAAAIGSPDRPAVMWWLVGLAALTCAGSTHGVRRFVMDWLPVVVIAAVIGTCACTPLKLNHAAGILISRTTPAVAIASLDRQSAESNESVSVAQAQVKNAAPSANAMAAAGTRSSNVNGV